MVVLVVFGSCGNRDIIAYAEKVLVELWLCHMVSALLCFLGLRLFYVTHVTVRWHFSGLRELQEHEMQRFPCYAVVFRPKQAGRRSQCSLSTMPSGSLILVALLSGLPFSQGSCLSDNQETS